MKKEQLQQKVLLCALPVMLVNIYIHLQAPKNAKIAMLEKLVFTANLNVLYVQLENMQTLQPKLRVVFYALLENMEH